jgi:N-acetylglucosaminyldiphosphoundecaprenol N-acetyl-beta-D-mannosaminyltransferase
MLSRFLYGRKGLKERVVSTDVWIDILNICRQTKKKVFFFGGHKLTKEEFYDSIKRRFPGLIVEGYNNGYSYDTLKIITEINKVNPDILIVGLGTPKQEKWISYNFSKLNVPIILSVGSAIDFYSGYKKRAPEFMRRYALEWLYRLFQEPKRLWKRYLLGIPVFMFKMLIFKFNLRKNK